MTRAAETADRSDPEGRALAGRPRAGRLPPGRDREAHDMGNRG